MDNGQFFDEAFKEAICRAGAQARIETLRAGVPVFYKDRNLNVDLVEYPNGQKFEIRFLERARNGQNYEVVRELDETAL